MTKSEVTAMRILLSALLVVLANCVYGVMLPVPSSYPTIVAAINVSVDGDTILISPGIYQERIVLPSGRRTIASNYLLNADSSIISQTILEPNPANNPDTMAIMELWDTPSTIRVIGLTLQNGRGIYGGPRSSEHWLYGGAVFQRGGEMRFDHCVFHDNFSDMAGAVMVEHSGILTLEHCGFRDNDCAGQGIIRADSADLHISNCRLNNNHPLLGAVVDARFSHRLVLDSTSVDSNQNDQAWLGTIFGYYCDSVIVRKSEFRMNSVEAEWHTGAGLHIFRSAALVEDCNFSQNLASAGAAIIASEADMYAKRCRFENNLTVGSSGAVIGLGRPIYLEDCVFRNNQSPAWPALNGTSSIYLLRCEFTNNIATDYSDGAAILAPDDSLVADNCIFSGNQPAALSNRINTGHIVNVNNCYWGDPSGPYHAELNPQGRGDTIFGTGIDFTPWLTEPPQAADDPFIPHPSSFSLSSYPNPFNPTCTITFSLREHSPVTMKVYDLMGRTVRTLLDKPLEAGDYHFGFDGSSLPSGIYFARIETKSQAVTHKMALIR